jgi:hypothetical protein
MLFKSFPNSNSVSLHPVASFRQLPQSPLKLLAFFGPALAQPYSRAAAVLVDELDAGRFKCPPNYIERCRSRLTDSSLKLMDSNNPNSSHFCERVLAPR